MVAAGSYAGRGMSDYVANTTCWPIHPQFARPGGPFLTSTTTHIGSSYQARGCTPAMRRNVERVDSISAIQNTAGLPYCLPGPLLDQPCAVVGGRPRRLAHRADDRRRLLGP